MYSKAYLAIKKIQQGVSVKSVHTQEEGLGKSVQVRAGGGGI